MDLQLLLLELGIALLLARIFGYAFERVKQPAVIGEILAGIIVGPFIMGRIFGINFISPSIEQPVDAIARIGIILLLFLSGIDTGINEIKNAGKSGLITSAFDVGIAFLFGYLVGTFMGYDTLHSIAIGNIFSATSVGITVRTLMEMNALHTNVGNLILTVAVLDDILGIVVLSITLGKGSPEILIVKITIFFLVFLAILYGLYKSQGLKIRTNLSRFALTLAISFCFLFSFFAMSMGLAAITGSFFAGLLLSVVPQRKRILNFVRQIGEVFFIPIFFVWVGSSFDFSAFSPSQLSHVGKLLLLFIPMALIGKIIGCSAGAKVNGFSSRDALAVGVGMMPRMEVALIVITTEISMGIFKGAMAHQMLAATILLVIISSLITPFILKAIYRAPEE
ncbi:MAG: cation:proton antiporter [Thermoplasmata archaeon]|nr:cation:proton antiporter [Thermoplasmata archaeon]